MAEIIKDISFKPAKINELRTNYSLFHPSPSQTQILFDIAEKLSSKIPLPEDIMRNVLIQGLINWQIRNERFHYEAEFFQPQYRAANTFNIINEMVNIISSLMEDPNEAEKSIRPVFIEIWEYYVRKYAGRS